MTDKSNCPWLPSPINLTTYVQGASDYEVFCAILQKLNEFSDRLDNSIQDAVNQANAYTDSKLQQFRNEFNSLQQEILDTMAELSDQQSEFITLVNEKLNIINNRVNELSNNIDASVLAMQAYTNSAIESNNGYILEQIESQLIGVRVIDFFTGKEISIQEMFDKLAKFHLADALTYSKYADKNITYTSLFALGITYAQLINNGNTLIPNS